MARENQIEILAHRHFPRKRWTKCEENLLDAVATGEVAYCGGTDSLKTEPSENLGKNRTQSDLDAELLRWLCTDSVAKKLVDPRGIRLKNAHIARQLDLSFATVDFPLSFEDSRFDKDINLAYSQLAHFILNSSQVRGIAAYNAMVRGDFILKKTIAESKVDLTEAKLGGDLDATGGTFKNAGHNALAAENLRAVNIYLYNRFTADGEVDLKGTQLKGNLVADGGIFKNHGQYALSAENLTAASDVALDGTGVNIAGSANFKDFSALGQMDFIGAQVKGSFVWEPTPYSDHLFLNLSHAAVGPLFDKKDRWPRAGNLNLDGFVYSRFAAVPVDAKSRLDWLDLQRLKIPPVYQRFMAYMHRLLCGETQRGSGNPNVEFRPQPYEQLAKILRENGDDAGAKNVLIAMENAHWWYGNIGFWDRCWTWILWVTIGYGYDLWRSLLFIGGFIVVGTVLFFLGP